MICLSPCMDRGFSAPAWIICSLLQSWLQECLWFLLLPGRDPTMRSWAHGFSLPAISPRVSLITLEQCFSESRTRSLLPEKSLETPSKRTFPSLMPKCTEAPWIRLLSNSSAVILRLTATEVGQPNFSLPFQCFPCCAPVRFSGLLGLSSLMCPQTPHILTALLVCSLALPSQAPSADRLPRSSLLIKTEPPLFQSWAPRAQFKPDGHFQTIFWRRSLFG